MNIDLKQMLKELYQISGFRISVYDTEWREIASYPQQLSGFCSCIQKNPDAKKICIHNDRLAFQSVKQSGEPYIYRCQFGLYEAVAPLYYFGMLSGYLMMGQVLETAPNSRKQVLDLALPYCDDKDAMQTIIHQMPSCSSQTFSSYLTIMSICAEYITLSNRFRPVHQNLAQSIKEYLELHYPEKITLNTLCRQFYCSRATLMTAFRQEYDQTINRFLLIIRLRVAKEKLTSGNDSISEVAIKCGFADQNYFCKVFRQQEGLTPTQYRNINHDKEQ
ncbi:MAG: PocR ligand-binding domain-containing protein [Clostridiales bacterium]|nr:PocR ligand-binding domain-containing protein [Clostridiales bacterium]